MRTAVSVGAAMLLVGCGLLLARGARCEVVEEIVAKVNDDIITKSDLDQADRDLVAEAYRRYTGKELDAQIREARAGLLQNLIDRKILVHRAQRLYDIEKMGNAFLTAFKEQQQIKSDDELKKLLDQEGMTLQEWKQKLIEMGAPDEVLRYEVFDRVAVGDKEVEAYYQSHPKEFEIPAEVKLREIVLLAEGDKKDARRADAEKVRERAAAPGSDFAALAKEVSEAGTRAEGGLLDKVKRGDLSPELEQVAFSLPIGEVSPVVDTPHGFHILKVEARTEDRMQKLDEIRESLRDKITREKSRGALEEFLKKARSEAEVWVSPKYQNRLAPPVEDAPPK